AVAMRNDLILTPCPSPIHLCLRQVYKNSGARRRLPLDWGYAWNTPRHFRATINSLFPKFNNDPSPTNYRNLSLRVKLRPHRPMPKDDSWMGGAGRGETPSVRNGHLP